MQIDPYAREFSDIRKLEDVPELTEEDAKVLATGKKEDLEKLQQELEKGGFFRQVFPSA